MNHRERLQSLLSARKADRRGFWKGNPSADALKAYYPHYGVATPLQLAQRLGDDFYWLPADLVSWRNASGKDVFDHVGKMAGDGQESGPIFAECEDPREIERHDTFPDPETFDLEGYGRLLDEALATGMGVAGGAWSCFYHVVSDYFGMENYFCKMHTDPAVVHALTERVVDLFARVNEKVLDRYADKVDCLFMGNDFGTQLDLMVSPEHFRTFILPYYKKLFAIAYRHDKPVMLHSYGAIGRVIPDLIDAGISALHNVPAANLEAMREAAQELD